MKLHRRTWALLSASLLLGACAGFSTPSPSQPNPIVFVHGNGDSAALWQTTVWRFESNGWPTDRLHAIDVPYPLARDADDKPQAGRTSAQEHMAFLRDEVQAVLRRTGAQQVILVGNSRGGNAIRNFICNGGGAAVVSHAVLGGTPNHGVQAIAGLNEANEFSGTGPFLRQLNAPKNAQGDEVCGPTRWMTIRSDSNDKYAQPDGLWLGMKGKPTGVGFDGPELKGATNVVIPRIDHRETSYSPAAFEATYRFITGQAPRPGLVRQNEVLLSGKLVGLGLDPLDAASGNQVNNLPLRGARLEVYATDPATGVRQGPAVHQQTVGDDGRWGPMRGRSDTPYEFVIQAAGYATTHIYRSPLPRSSTWLNMRPERVNDADRAAQAVLSFNRPRGYFDPGRDTLSLDGQSSLPGVPPGAGVATSRLRLNDSTPRSVSGSFNGERITGRTWPMSQGHTTVLELTE
jgi:hypothetical protein